MSVAGDGLSVSGEIDMAVAADLLVAIIRCSTADDRLSMTVDMAGVTFIDSTGISALVEAHKRLDEVGCRMRLTNVPPCASTVFDLTGVSDYLGVTAPTATT
jgi:anti-anti-sigma factor